MAVVTNTHTLESVLPQKSTSTITRVDGQKQMGKDAFLKLLVAQMKNQDPSNPVDNTQMTAQLAQFTSLEQLQNLNTQFTTMTSTLSSMNNYQALNLVGREITAKGDSFSVANGTSTQGMYTLDEAASVVVRIYNENGDVVRALGPNAVSSGTHTINWDAKDTSGKTVADGNYTFEIVATAADKSTISDIPTQVRGKVTGMTLSATDAPILMINNMKVNVKDVQQVVNPTQTTTAN